MKMFAMGCVGLCLIMASSAHGADAAAGQRLAQLRCAACHIVAPGGRNEVADAPPFVAIGRKFDFNYDALVLALGGPHRKMNFTLRRRDSEDVAAYIGTLAR
jgi:mono/diheme cytochrome c family protein